MVWTVLLCITNFSIENEICKPRNLKKACALLTAHIKNIIDNEHFMIDSSETDFYFGSPPCKAPIVLFKNLKTIYNLVILLFLDQIIVFTICLGCFPK